MKTTTIYRSDYTNQSDYRKALTAVKDEYGDYKVKVDDGKGSWGWMFFESAEDMRVWRQQK